MVKDTQVRTAQLPANSTRARNVERLRRLKQSQEPFEERFARYFDERLDQYLTAAQGGRRRP